jgi:pimeloyl-ACP methyl ester carboxylesterase
MNGMELAARHPDAVDRLVVTSSGLHVVDDARPAVERLLSLARDRDWAAIRARLADAMFADWRRVAYPASVLTVGRLVMPRPADPGDVTTSLEAILAYDGSDTAPRIETPTLVAGVPTTPTSPNRSSARRPTRLPAASYRSSTAGDTARSTNGNTPSIRGSGRSSLPDRPAVPRSRPSCRPSLPDRPLSLAT